MARITSFTIFVFVTLVAYTLFATLFGSLVYGTAFQSPYGGTVSNWNVGIDYTYSQMKNVSIDETVTFDTFTPDRNVYWYGDTFRFKRKGVEWWDSWIWWEMSGSPITEQDIIDNFDTSRNYSKFIFDQGGTFQTDSYIYPQINEDGEFMYYPISNSLGNGTVTIFMGVNGTVPTIFDIGIIFGILTGFTYYGAPIYVSAIIGGIWWMLCLLVIVKLVID